MLQIHYGLNQPFNSAYTPAREAVDPSINYSTGMWVKLSNGKVTSAVTPADGFGAEVVFEPNNKNWTGTVPTISGLFEASSDQYVSASTFTDGCLLVTRNGQLDVSAGVSEDPYAIGFAMGVPTSGVLRFKKFR